MADEGDTPSTLPWEESEHHPPAREAQFRIQVSMPTEGSAQLGMKRNWEGLLPRHHLGHTSGSSRSLPQDSAHPAPTQSPENCCLGPGAQHGRAQRASHKIWLMRGDTPSTLPWEESEHHPPAREAQCRLQESVPTEGSAQPGMKRKQGRPAAQTPPGTHLGVQSQPAMGLSTPGSDPEPQNLCL
ncbi:unnamed protein product [Rangifer tarandus platyrhynchus]|uniref:Uncharacterized protein n=1 Tax=Rangifer tarandus platyrhynchus TaxID=3082113 RepID=A0AC59Z1S0_RANTA